MGGGVRPLRHRSRTGGGQPPDSPGRFTERQLSGTGTWVTRRIQGMVTLALSGIGVRLCRG